RAAGRVAPSSRSVTVPVPIRLPVSAAPVVARALQARGRAGDRIGSLRRSLGFPWTTPTWPGGVERPPVEKSLGSDFDTDWARTPAARVARALLLDGVVKPAVGAIASPEVTGADRLDGFDGPVIFTANHASHLDTPLLLTSLPERFRHKTVVAAAADYFFDRRVKAIGSALVISAIPIDRTTVSRRSLDRATALLEDGWNLVIFPEGGRTPDGWGQEFRAGAAFLATRNQVPVVPVHIEGSRRVLRKGGRGLHRSTTHVTFGTPIRPEGELGDTRALSAAIEQAVAVLADEQATDWWSARRRAAGGDTPALRGPDANAWRRSWILGEGRRTASGTRWPS
ncbi:MAG: lysophospholipid acyltransferase family protein, partial [Acidimicrobiales bacterium]